MPDLNRPRSYLKNLRSNLSSARGELRGSVPFVIIEFFAGKNCCIFNPGELDLLDGAFVGLQYLGKKTFDHNGFADFG